MSMPALQLEPSDVPEARQLKLYLPTDLSQSTGGLESFLKVRFASGYEGEISSRFDTADLRNWLECLPDHLDSADSRLIYRVRNRVYHVADPLGIHADGICVKAFKAPPRLRSLYYSYHGSKAARAHRYAIHLFEHGVSHAQPLGYFEQWQGNRLAHSYLLTQFVGDSIDLFSETNSLLRDNPDSAVYIDLLRFTAESMRRMHDSGYVHRDLGGQNFLFKRSTNGGWKSPTFIDLNRGRLLKSVDTRQRARDLAKLEIPSHFLKIFYHIYFRDQPIPRDFTLWEKWYRSRITLHNKSRKYRHPIRQYHANRTQVVVSTGKPAESDFWLWDEKSGQPSVVFKSKDRRRFRSSADMLKIAWSSLSHARSIHANYQELKAAAYSLPIEMRQRFGISVEISDDYQQQLDLLTKTPEIPTLIRCYFHKGHAGLDLCEAAVNQLHQRGHEVSLSLTQSRQAVIQPIAWEEFLSDALARLNGKIRFVEIGHAVNRAKWGYWTLADMLSTFNTVNQLREKYPYLTFLGPAVNDFEYHYYPYLLDRMATKVDGLSCHLYVDRRGQPENFQGRFSLLEKCVLGRAIAENWGDKRFYITETNWPLQGAQEYSPLAGAYTHKEYCESDLHVSPENYADYMIRYALISLCSGMAERVWWWRLAGRGFGLINDVDGLKPRIGWNALIHFHNTVGADRFLQREEHDQVIWWHFERCSLAYSLTTAATRVPFGCKLVTDISGNPLPLASGEAVSVSGSPLYFMK